MWIFGEIETVGACREALLRHALNGFISPPMTRVFDMDDRARLPWRFFGATLSVLARLG